MGVSPSRQRGEQDMETALLKGYKFPRDRKPNRAAVDYKQKRNESEGETERLKQKASELYDYLIIFDNHKDTGVGGAVYSGGTNGRKQDNEQEEDDSDGEGGDTSAEEIIRTATGDERISWNEVSLIWFQTIPGEEEAKNRGVNWLRRAWIDRFRTGSVSNEQGGDRIPMIALQGLVREHVVDVLSRKAGLQLKIVPSSGKARFLYCLIRAPTPLLERKADDINYRLRLRREVDPGLAFWKTPIPDEEGKREYVEILEEKKLYEKAEANEILEELYLANKISPNDMEVFPETYEPTKKHWSRRVHTLERVADKVPCTANRYPAYTDFITQPHLRHLFEEYSSSALRGTSLFLPKDRLYLTKRILDEHFDFGVLVEQNIVRGVTALHDAAFGESIDRDWFLNNWVFFWRAPATQAGAPTVSHPAIDDATEFPCPFWMRFWAQPLMDVRAYFGEKIAFYFAWLGFYGYSLLTPTTVGIACILYDAMSRTADESRGIHVDEIIFALSLVSWSAYYKDSWDVESRWCALKWGTTNFTEEEFDRPQFVGDPDKPLRLSPITYQNETFYPEEKRSAAQCAGFFFVFLVVVLVLFIDLIIFALGYLAYESGLTAVSATLPVFALAMIIPVASDRYAEFALYLNNLENYRTDTNYENNLILKKFLFELPNSYGALAITAFLKGTLFVCTSGHDNCLMDLQVLIVVIFATRFFFAITAAFSNQIKRCFGLSSRTEEANSAAEGERLKKLQEQRASSAAAQDQGDMSLATYFEQITNPLAYFASASTSEDEDVELSVGEYRGPAYSTNGLDVYDDDDILGGDEDDDVFNEIEAPRFEAELALEDYEGTFDDYAEIVLQMGLVTMFSLGFYLTPFLAALEILLQIRVDAYKLCALTRRPDASLAEDVGSWGSLMDVMGFLAIFTNAGIIVYTTTAFLSYTQSERLLIFFIIQHLLGIVKLLTNFLASAEPPELEIAIKRNDFVIQRHKEIDDVVEDQDEDEIEDELSLPGEGEDPQTNGVERKRGNVDRDALQASKLGGQGLEINPETIRNLEWLRRKLRDCATDIKIARQQYRDACRIEDFKPELGVSFSRKQPDLALGLVTLLVLEAENVGTKHNPIDAKNCRVVVHVRDSTRPQDRKYEGTVGPGPQVSKPAKKPGFKVGSDQAEKRKLTYGARLSFNQSFTLAPIKSSKAEIFLEILDAHKHVRRAHATLPLSDLTDQKQHALTLVLVRVTPDRSSDEAAVIYVKARFQFSRIAPLKQRIYTLLDEQRRLERDIMHLQLGKPAENDWNFPETPETTAERDLEDPLSQTTTNLASSP